MSFSVIIPSKNPNNLIECVRSIRKHEPGLEPEKIICVDDGARAGAAGETRGIAWVDGIKPFVYARNANIGIRAALDDDVFLMNDDARLLTAGGFSRLRAECLRMGLGAVSAAITGDVGNLAQLPADAEGIRREARMVCFVCVFIPRATIARVGMLDERFVAYGFDDDDYCLRIRQAGLQLGIFDGCRVEHGRLPSTFRTAGSAPLEPNRRIFAEKWGDQR